MATDSQDILVFLLLIRCFCLIDKVISACLYQITTLILFLVQSRVKNLTDGKAFRKSNKDKFKDPLDVKRLFWSLVPMGGQRLAKGHQNWLIIDLSSNLFGVASTDNADTSDNINDNSIQAGSNVRAIEKSKN